MNTPEPEGGRKETVIRLQNSAGRPADGIPVTHGSEKRLTDKNGVVRFSKINGSPVYLSGIVVKGVQNEVDITLKYNMRTGAYERVGGK